MTDYEENHEHELNNMHERAHKTADHSFTGLLMMLAGFTTGLALGLLFAPASGIETREYLANKCDDAMGRIGEHTQTLRARGRKLVEPVRRKIKPFRGSVEV